MPLVHGAYVVRITVAITSHYSNYPSCCPRPILLSSSPLPCLPDSLPSPLSASPPPCPSSLLGRRKLLLLIPPSLALTPSRSQKEVEMVYALWLGPGPSRRYKQPSSVVPQVGTTCCWRQSWERDRNRDSDSDRERQRLGQSQWITQSVRSHTHTQA